MLCALCDLTSMPAICKYIAATQWRFFHIAPRWLRQAHATLPSACLALNYDGASCQQAGGLHGGPRSLGSAISAALATHAERAHSQGAACAQRGAAAASARARGEGRRSCARIGCSARPGRRSLARRPCCGRRGCARPPVAGCSGASCSLPCRPRGSACRSAWLVRGGRRRCARSRCMRLGGWRSSRGSPRRHPGGRCGRGDRARARRARPGRRRGGSAGHSSRAGARPPPSRAMPGRGLRRRRRCRRARRAPAPAGRCRLRWRLAFRSVRAAAWHHARLSAWWRKQRMHAAARCTAHMLAQMLCTSCRTCGRDGRRDDAQLQQRLRADAGHRELRGRRVAGHRAQQRRRGRAQRGRRRCDEHLPRLAHRELQLLSARQRSACSDTVQPITTPQCWASHGRPSATEVTLVHASQTPS